MDATPAAGLAPLQFETAAPAEGASSAARTACTTCRAPVGGAYYMANGQLICSRCRGQIEGGAAGTALERFARAALFGSGAAVAGCALNYAWMSMTRSEFALIAIIVGFMVGAAIRRGNGGRGGWPYQLMSVGLAYLAIVLAYVPIVVGAADGSASARELSGGALYAVAVIGSLLWPFLAIVKSPISALIIAIGLYQAWRQAKGVKLEITGPYHVNQRTLSVPAAAAPAGG